MSYATREEANRASALKRPRESPQTYPSPPPKRPKTDQNRTTELTESTAPYDACPMPDVTDYFYEELISKAPGLSQLFPTLCHDIYVVRRWLGSAGCAIQWRMVIEDIKKGTSPPNSPNPLTGLIARCLSKLRPQREISSSKFQTLCDTLGSRLALGDARRIVVFMRHDAVARVAVRMLTDPVLDGVRPMLAQDYGDQLMKAKEAVEHGKFNVIVTTQLPIVLTLRAPVLIAFDEVPCHLTQALCREATTDHLVRMVERGRLRDTKFLHSTPSDAAAQEWTKGVASPCGTIPPPSTYIHPSTEPPALPFTHRRLRDPTTAAWLSPPDALTVVHLILQERSKSGLGVHDQRVTHFSKRNEDPRHVCQLNIPGFEDCDEIEEYGHSRVEALVSCCFSACKLLQTNGLLEPTHFPTVHPFVPVPRVIEPQQSKKAKSNGIHTHPRRTPLFWSLSTETLGGLWHPTIVFIDGSMGEFGLLAILTRRPLPTTPDFPLFISEDPVSVRLRKCQPGLLLPDELEQLRRTTLRIMRFVGNKPFVCDLNQLPYLLFPLEPETPLLASLHEPSWAHEGYPRLGSPCASGVVMSMAASAFLPIATGSAEDTMRDLSDAVIQDRKIEYTKHYFVEKVREDLTPLHKPQEGERQHGYESYLEHCKARIKDFQGIKNLNQPLVEVEVAPGVVNRLDPSLKSQISEKSIPQIFIPELCVKSTVPASIARTAFALPSIMTKIDETLLVKELNARMFDNVIREDLLREALTPPAAETGYSYERLEILGDAILKYLISCHVFVHDFGTLSNLHAHRRDIINNKALYQHAVNAELPQFILSKRFSAKTWYPASIPIRDSFNPVPNDEMFPAPEDKSVADPDGAGYAVHKQTTTHQLGDKTPADVVEAILGAAYLSAGFPGACIAAQSFAIPVLEYDTTSEMGKKMLPEPPAEVSHLLKPSTIQQLETIIGHRFRRRYYLAQVLANKTGPQYQSTSCERLGFIGDGILDFLTIIYIYEREPNLAPGSLTLLKCAMVANSALAALCVKCGIHQFMDTRASGVSNDLSAYVSGVTTALVEEQRTSSREGRPPSQYWLRIQSPKAFSNIMEGILGALYVSDNCSLEGAEKFFDRVFKPFFDEFLTFEMLTRNAADAVLEMLNRLGCKQYSRVHNVENGVHLCKLVWHGNIFCEAKDANFDVAMQRTSEKCLQVLTEKPKLLMDACNCLTTQTSRGTKPSQRRR